MPYRSNRNLSRLLLQSGEARANAELQRGQIWGNAIQNIGNIAGRTLTGLLEERENAPIRAMERENVTLRNQALKDEARGSGMAKQIQGSALRQTEDGVWTYDRDLIASEFQRAGIADRLPGVMEGLDAFDASARSVLKAKQEGLAGLAYGVTQLGNTPQAFGQALDLAIKNGFVTQTEAGRLLSQINNDPDTIAKIVTQIASSSPTFAAKLGPQAPKLHNVAPGTSVIDANNPQAGPVFTAPPNEPQAQPFNLSPGQTRFGPDGQPVASLPPTPSAPQRDTEPLVPVIGDDGQPVLLPRSQAAGRRPASTREQGRPVTSGDANRIAELDTSLNDLATLADTLSETAKATGTVAKAGAMLWNPITELTGWGEDAKKRQGVIDRVKQVIGKALEGGVLRKEDEYKYTKILPTIGDTQAVATSKLAGLQKALVLRRQTTLEALADAGYDTSKFGDTTNAATVRPLDDDPLGLFK